MDVSSTLNTAVQMQAQQTSQKFAMVAEKESLQSDQSAVQLISSSQLSAPGPGRGGAVDMSA